MNRQVRSLGSIVLPVALVFVPACSCTGVSDLELTAEPDGAIEQPAPPDPEPDTSPEPNAEDAPPRVEEREENPLADDGADEEPAEESGEPEPEPEPEPEESFPLAGVAFHFATDVRAEPDANAPLVGYLRRGARVRVAEKAGRRGCPRGWYRIEGGGYVCHGGGVVVGTDPDPWPDAPPPPQLDQPLPYAYHTIVRDDVPEYWERPVGDMERQTAVAIRRLRAPAEEAAEAEEEEAEGNEEGDAGAEQEPSPAPPEPPSTDAGPDGGDAGSERALPSFVRLLLARGFIVSGSTIEGRWFKSVRGRFVERTFLTEREGPEFRGLELGPDDGLPMAFVVRGRAKALRPVQGPRLRFETAGVLRRLSPLPVLGEVERQDETYVSIGRGLLARSRVLAIVEPVARPPDVGPEEKWIDVNLTRQTLVAYEGDRPVFATLISSGRAADGFGTPTGTFRIRTKHVTATMDDPDGGAEAYSIEDVPWTMYFQDSYALHGAFWHSRFGRQRSHGCVNLAPADARWIFFWTGPELPPGWHGVRASRSHPGTTIVIHD